MKAFLEEINIWFSRLNKKIFPHQCGQFIHGANKTKAEASVGSHRLSSCLTQALERGLSRRGTRLSCPAACGRFPDQGINCGTWTGKQILNHWTTREAPLSLLDLRCPSFPALRHQSSKFSGIQTQLDLYPRLYWSSSLQTVDGRTSWPS